MRPAAGAHPMSSNRLSFAAPRLARKLAPWWRAGFGTWTAIVGLAGITVWSLWLRVQDPLLTNPVVPAEDPFTHIALAREHLATHSIDPLYAGSAVYPPGLDLLLALASAWTGLGFTSLAQTMPGLLGAIGVLGIAGVAWRAFGRTAAVMGALVYAYTPELVFRSQLLAPTALDLALMPVVLYALTQLLAGRWRWLPVTMVAALFETVTHPWTLALLATGGAATIAVWALRDARQPSLVWGGVAAAIALVGTLLAISFKGCAGWCGAGFDAVVRPPAGLSIERWALALGLASWMPLLGLAIARVAGRSAATAKGAAAAGSKRSWRPAAVALLQAVGLVVILGSAWRRGLPNFVSPFSFGWPILVLSALGLVLSPFARHPLASAAAGFAWGTMPLVLFNPFQSEFWPHRTMAYLAIGCSLLVAAGTHVILEAAPQASRVRHPMARRILAPGAVMGAALIVAGGGIAVAAATPTPAPWYRLFDACQASGLEAVAAQARNDTQALYLLGSWQAKLVVSALGSNASRLWYAENLMVDASKRATVVDASARQGRHVHLVLDPYSSASRPPYNLTGLDAPLWTTTERDCPGGPITLIDLSEEPRFKPTAVGNPNWIEVDVLTPAGVTEVDWQAGGTGWKPMERTAWGTWADGAPVHGNVTFQAKLRNGDTVQSQQFSWAP